MIDDRNIYYYQYLIKSHGVPVSLIPERNGRYMVVYKKEHLGSYANAMMAADDVGGGHTFSPLDGTDFSILGIPRDINEWEKKIFVKIGRLRTV